MEWNEFYERFKDGDYDFVLKEYLFLKSYGPSSEVLEIVEIFDKDAHRITFLSSAHRFGTVFQPEDFKKLSHYLNDEKLCDYILSSSNRKYTKDELKLVEGYVSDEAIQFVADKNGIEYFDENPFSKHVEFPESNHDSNTEGYHPKKRQTAGNLFKGLLGGVAILGGIFLGTIFHSANKMNKPRVCNGDCANCPPHFGYRYGRWYYGHDHVGGCEFGGNRGSGRID